MPDKLHAGTVHDGELGTTGKDASVCQGDTGGPALRERNGRIELAGVSGHSRQGGCFGQVETRKDAVESRFEDVNHWNQQIRSLPKRYLTAAGDFDGDGRADISVTYDYGRGADGRVGT
ncbi:trypsin-like serine protease [Streptomyces sp. Ac-502]|uniref:FG-GAP repeat protein n=1 Tax=Streptomyces sp. Ac-502 TaxID=3342801 RepID=UPI0038624E60